MTRLARAQERELRAWLFEGRPPGSFHDSEVTTVSQAVSVIVRDVEASHRVAVETVVVGDCALNGELRALLAAGREATVNAASWSGAPRVSIFVEVEPAQVSVFVRDRGQGFDPDAVGEDRRGIAESIRARMTRHGGSAVIRSVPGQGTEVELVMPRTGAGRERDSPDHDRRGKVRVFLVDDHQLFLCGVRAELGDAVEIVGEAGEVGAAIELIGGGSPTSSSSTSTCPAGGARRSSRPSGAATRGALPGPLGVRRGRGRHRGDPGRGPRLRHQVDLGPRADRRGRAGARR